MKRWLKILLPAVVLTMGFGGAMALVGTKVSPEMSAPERGSPLVRVMRVETGPVRLEVRSQGVVRPQLESVLAAQVSGQVTGVAPDFEVGGFFARGQMLVSLDRRDYEAALKEAEARVASARLSLAQEKAEAEVAIREWSRESAGANTLALREHHVASSEAELEAALAAVDRAHLDLERTTIRAPFNSRLSERFVDLGEFLTSGRPVARLQGVESAEVLLPISPLQLSYLDLSSTSRQPPDGQPEVELYATVGDRRVRWSGELIRTVGELDRQTQQHQLLVRVAAPYTLQGDNRGALAVGMFVEAEVAGRQVPEAVALPRQAMRAADQVLIVEAGDRLRFRKVHVVKYQDDMAIVDRGLENGESVCVSPLDVAVDGMKVRTVEVESMKQPEAPAPEPQRVLPEAELNLTENTTRAGTGGESQACHPQARLSGIELRPSADSLEARIALLGTPDYSSFKLSAPSRLVVDLRETTLADSRSLIRVGDGALDRIRISQYQPCPSPIVRIVFDLTGGGTKTTVEPHPAGLSVWFPGSETPRPTGSQAAGGDEAEGP